MARDRDFMLTTDERRLKRLKRRRIFVVSVLLLLVLVLGFFAGRPTLNAIKAWQARRHAERAFAYLAKEQWTEARNEAVAAYQLRATEPQALRAVARYLSRTRQAGALDFWQELEKITPLTREDRQDEAAIAIMAGETTRAEVAVQALLESKGADPLGWLLAAQLSMQKGVNDEAMASLAKVFADTRTTEPQQFQAALLELSLTSGSEAADERRKDGWLRIEKLAQGKSAVALDALVLLARRALTTKDGGTGSVPSGKDQTLENAERSTPNAQRPITEQPITKNEEPITSELAQRLASHPLAKAPQKLLALDLREHADVRAGLADTERETLILGAIAQWKDADPNSLVTLAAWLNGKGEYQRQLDTIPLAKALQDKGLFLQHLDALGALGRWMDIKQLLGGERFPLDPVVQSMYLARCNAQLGEKTSAENNWKRALEAAAGDPGKLLTLGDYAAKNGNLAIAESAYATAATESPKLRPAFQGRLRIAQAAGDSKKIHAVLADMLRLWPNDVAVQNDEAYLRLLLSPGGTTSVSSQNSTDMTEPVPPSDELKEIETLAEKLVQRNPRSLPHRTLLALARLRQNRTADALSVYDNITVAPGALTPSALAVHAAVLAANGRTDDAKAEARQIKREQLVAEEQELLSEVIGY